MHKNYQLDKALEIEQYFNNSTLIDQTINQIKKDFIEFDFSIEVTNKGNNLFEELIAEISPVIDYLLEKQLEKLMSLIYRIDIDERKIKLALNAEKPHVSISELVVKRELQKVVIRNYYSGNL